MRANSIPHQYIISTHSADVVNASEAQTIHLVRWADEQSRIEELSIADTHDLRRALDEVGARVSDVFGADNLIWVEGATERECFPLVLKHYGRSVKVGTSFVALVNTGDLDGRRAEDVCSIYERLSVSSALMPQTLAFSLDRERKTSQQIDDLKRRLRGLVHFLPRRTYENYLLVPSAIAAVLNKLPTFHESPTDAASVESWIREHGSEKTYLGDESRLAAFDATWATTVNAPQLLYDLFSDLSKTRERFDKLRHSPELTRWLLENDPNTLKELADYLFGLLPPDHPTGTSVARA